jgi:sulfur carrier protein ThiS
MKVTVKLYGTLSRLFEGYDHSHGLQVEIHEQATVAELLTSLEISDNHETVAVMGGRVMDDNEPLSNGNVISVFQRIAGG